MDADWRVARVVEGLRQVVVRRAEMLLHICDYPDGVHDGHYWIGSSSQRRRYYRYLEGGRRTPRDYWDLMRS